MLLLSFTGEYVAVVEEQQLPALLKMISPATGGEGSPVSNIPQSIITLPATESVPFAPGPSNPLSSYYQQNESQAWNPTGLDLVDLSLPCGVFLAPANLAQEYREQAQHNNRRVRPYTMMQYSTAAEVVDWILSGMHAVRRVHISVVTQFVAARSVFLVKPDTL